MNFHLRPFTTDRDIYEEVFIRDVYEIKSRAFSPNSIVIDIGGHIGIFSGIMSEKPVKRIYCYEASLDNYAVALNNLKGYISSGLVLLHNKAVWESNSNVTELCFTKYSNNCAAGDVLSNSGTESISCVGLDQEIESILKANNISNIDLLKIDCEGAEYNILYTSKLLNCIRELKIEFHNIDEYTSINTGKFGYSCSGEGLKAFLVDLGYTITLYKPSHQHFVPGTNVRMLVGTIFATKN
jgi:FkbM family methyltransferase